MAVQSVIQPIPRMSSEPGTTSLPSVSKLVLGVVDIKPLREISIYYDTARNFRVKGFIEVKKGVMYAKLCSHFVPQKHSTVGSIFRKLVQISYMWQSWVEIEHYFVVYFDCVTVFEAL